MSEEERRRERQRQRRESFSGLYDAETADYAPTTDDATFYIDSDGNRRKRNWRRAERARDRMQGKWYQSQYRGLEDDMPTEDDLTYEAAVESGDIMLGDSAAGQAAADPEAIAAQRRALEDMSGDASTFRDIYRQGGYTDIERAQMERTMQQARANERAQRQAIEQRMGARGMMGSGQQLAAELAAQQGQANTAQMQGAEIAAAGQERALRSLAQASDLAGAQGRLSSQMRGQSFEEEFGRGSAIDRFRQSDVEYQRDVDQRRADRETEARRQGTQARQQMFENKAGITDRIVDAAQKSKEEEDRTKGRIDASTQANRSAAVGGITGAIGGVGKMATGFGWSDVRLKTDVRRVGTSPSGIPEYTFRYVNDPSGRLFRGTLAQEVERLHPRAVAKTSSGMLAVNYDEIDVDFAPVREA